MDSEPQEKRIYNPYKSRRKSKRRPITSSSKTQNQKSSSDLIPNLRPSSSRRRSKQRTKKTVNLQPGLMNTKTKQKEPSLSGSSRFSQRGSSKERKDSVTKNKFFTSLNNLAGTIFNRKESLDVERIAQEKAHSIFNGSRKDSTKPSGNFFLKRTKQYFFSYSG